eukprot:TRINITY_DN11154_c0_g1_i1.p1 TRINITY_DN11154_c0_g1~~TRINITY_DN11154_c0_g1_i1.p1  ORF type:complete len:415 (+),score=153.76 TRINITY_DN11154_c0_g1_i1:63-1307(+)
MSLVEGTASPPMEETPTLILTEEPTEEENPEKEKKEKYEQLVKRVAVLEDEIKKAGEELEAREKQHVQEVAKHDKIKANIIETSKGKVEQQQQEIKCLEESIDEVASELLLYEERLSYDASKVHVARAEAEAEKEKIASQNLKAESESRNTRSTLADKTHTLLKAHAKTMTQLYNDVFKASSRVAANRNDAAAEQEERSKQHIASIEEYKEQINSLEKDITECHAEKKTLARARNEMAKEKHIAETQVANARTALCTMEEAMHSELLKLHRENTALVAELRTLQSANEAKSRQRGLDTKQEKENNLKLEMKQQEAVLYAKRSEVVASRESRVAKAVALTLKAREEIVDLADKTLELERVMYNKIAKAMQSRNDGLQKLQQSKQIESEKAGQLEILKAKRILEADSSQEKKKARR